jgi:hypothetical protein
MTRRVLMPWSQGKITILMIATIPHQQGKKLNQGCGCGCGCLSAKSFSMNPPDAVIVIMINIISWNLVSLPNRTLRGAFYKLVQNSWPG